MQEKGRRLIGTIDDVVTPVPRHFTREIRRASEDGRHYIFQIRRRQRAEVQRRRKIRAMPAIAAMESCRAGGSGTETGLTVSAANPSEP